MRIGSYEIANNLLLAPMAGVTDRPFRQLCRRLGAGLAVSEMISADASLWGTKKSVKRLDHDGEEAPISVQILGSDPQMMAQAAQANVAMGAQIIDINMGCPAKKVCKKSAGSALLKDEPLVADILKATVDAVDVPVTLKIRTGTDPQNRNGERIAEIAEYAGIQALSVHGRTRACKFAGQAEYETIRRIKQTVAIPVIANGDIDSPRKAAEVLERTGADALMIGRAAQGRPWIFNEINNYLTTGQLLPEPELEWVADILTRHVQQLYEFYGEYLGVRIARKHIAWYSKGRPEGAVFRNKINYSESSAEQLQAIKEYFQFLHNNRDLAA
ncbi:MAG: tRNA dihydrouridine synthase DusB [Candidatus Thiodiazotropha taylori]|uniref:tRNA-dihydrouridine synthase B n=1 Tax=Candidatus Thiodiazotropha taylori TaxID=2792791 RepID=A0A9E4N5P4_9GAMM|nr:tRNA dihydrouridine synthase DusB [Candidatus Thiodiazotropha taylori]MCG7968080.1 tRNA dihydrouridine synthase DusB [Candidatus Thiodiazotropha taylori]MCG8041170.1 tRNA dihydrouridine synthase DusB [Candidatus Thiodiazotropha taylori]MCG8049719.1 tRNA dihydrouridine synthase DusB [Candidatus Thiodiazotropha taylori]MCW4258118.1 tRNA dihydrouridine synthase DusB [Candidatus Thiodiazotropha taylori]